MRRSEELRGGPMNQVTRRKCRQIDYISNFLAFLFRSCSLEELGPENDNVVLAFKQLALEFGEKFNKQFNRDI